jgi:SAM-dependent methyltransferase
MTDEKPKYRNYERSAFLYDSYIPKADYIIASQNLCDLIQELRPNARTLLDVGCGTARHLEQMQSQYQVQGLELQQGFIDIAQSRCPDIPFHKGNMIDFELGIKFDVVTCLFAAIGYVKTLDNLKKAVACMANHLEPAGILIVEPWLFPDQYWLNKLNAEFIDQDDLKITRMFITKREGRISVYDIHYLVGSPSGIEYFVEREELGLYTNEEYLSSFELAGLAPIYNKDGGLFGHEHNMGIYIGEKM